MEDFKYFISFRDIVDISLKVSENIDDIFINICCDIFKNTEINNAYFNIIQNYIIIKGEKHVYDIINKLFEKIYDEYNLSITKLINTRDFIKLFFELKQNMRRLIKKLYLINSSVITQKSKESKNVSFLDYMDKLISYNKIINKKYFDIISDEINKNTLEKQDIINIYKINKYFYGLSYITHSKKDIIKIKIDDTFIEKYINVINDNINFIINFDNLASVSSDIIEKRINETRSICDMLLFYFDYSIVLKMYKNKLIERILTKDIINKKIIQLEYEFLKSFYRKSHPDYVSTVNILLNIKNTHHTDKFKDLIFDIVSEKYKDIVYNPDIVNFIILDTHYEDTDDITLPPELNIYFDLFEKYYKINYNKELQWIYKYCIIEVEINGETKFMNIIDYKKLKNQ